MQSSAEPQPLRCTIFKVSGSRTLETDDGGAYLAEALTRLGHEVVSRQIVADDAAAIRALALDAIETGAVDCLLLTGGTGLSRNDVTHEAVGSLFGKRLPGFGEMLRHLCFEAIGPLALLTRADAGAIGRTLVLVLPGAPLCVELAMDRLIGPILPKAIDELRHAPAATRREKR